MSALPFNMDVMNFLASHRPPWLTPLVLGVSDLGEVQGYLLISTLIYLVFDKRLAIRLTLLASLTMGLNHLLKIAIKNPRPFIREGDYLQKWAVPPDNARDLAAEFSTPSGHAMAAASVWSYLAGAVRRPAVRWLAVAAILLIGASRPYLGVHYVEDILLGWAVGLGVGLFALRFGDRMGQGWARFAYPAQVGVAVAASAAFWLVTIAVNGWRIDGEPRAFLGYAGVATGVVVAAPLELALVDFDPRSSSPAIKALRFVLGFALSFAALEGLGALFDMLAGKVSLAGYVLQYLRYVAVAVVGLFAAPWLFVRLSLAERRSEPGSTVAARRQGLASGA